MSTTRARDAGTLQSANTDTGADYQATRRFFLARGGDGPVITAAGNPDSADLKRVLLRAASLSVSDRSTLALEYTHNEGHLDGYWDTPLLRAIDKNLQQNVQILLDNGANPNGVLQEFQASYAYRFRRIKAATASNIRTFDVNVLPQDIGPAYMQTFPLMASELRARQTTISRFWTEPDSIALNISPNGDRLHSLVMAAGTTPAIFEQLLHAGADASFWVGTKTNTELPADDSMTPSCLCLSTPLHQAIAAGHMSMLTYILDSGFNPNARALIAGSQALTPLQQAIVSEESSALQIMLQHPRVDTDVRTPVYAVHALHFGIAHLYLDLIGALGVLKQQNPPTTALRHNLVHIACMLSSDVEVQLFAPKVRQSIHDIRSLDPQWRLDIEFQRAASSHHLQQAPRAPEPHYDGPRSSRDQDCTLPLPLMQRRFGPSTLKWFDPPSTQFFNQQCVVVRQLVADFGVQLACQRDYCGNTPLHYLASARIVNAELIAWLRSYPVVDNAWKQCRNTWQHTPGDLWLDNVTIMEIGRQPVGFAALESQAREQSGHVDIASRV